MGNKKKFNKGKKNVRNSCNTKTNVKFEFDTYDMLILKVSKLVLFFMNKEMKKIANQIGIYEPTENDEYVNSILIDGKLWVFYIKKPDIKSDSSIDICMIEKQIQESALNEKVVTIENYENYLLLTYDIEKDVLLRSMEEKS